MKKAATLLIFLCLSAAAFAQSAAFGVTAGFTSSQLKLKEVDVKSASGFNAGVTCRLPLLAGLVLQPGVTYNVKGSNWDAVKSQSKLGYFEIPVQVQWGIDLLMLRPYVFAEPFLGYALSGRKVLAGNESGMDMSNMKNRFEYGFGLGAGVDLFDHLQVSFKYFWNVEDCDINSYFSALSDKLKKRNSFDGLMISIGYFF